MQPGRDIRILLDIMARLRTPETGCPWDLAQSFETIAPYTIEEAYEVADAIERRDMAELPDELGDLLLQVVFHARMAEEAGLFDFGDVVERITTKMVRRHPHVFGESRADSSAEVRRSWEAIKAEEKAAKPPKARLDGESRTLAGVPVGLPGLTRAVKLQEKASRVGFDWNDPKLVVEKIREEADELESAAARAPSPEIEEEVGDLLFAVANLARHLKVDPEAALRRANLKFMRRFAAIERSLAAQGRLPKDSTLEEMDALWDEAKRLERQGEAAGRQS
ncbi:MAG: nucleoside triphosphate pyrophosphohydrolase [Pseudomonadota bacterium]|nr:nucleoside triphosphate pyrophosphohydrolase [Pseudomonadota bacterium]